MQIMLDAILEFIFEIGIGCILVGIILITVGLTVTADGSAIGGGLTIAAGGLCSFIGLRQIGKLLS